MPKGQQPTQYTATMFSKRGKEFEIVCNMGKKGTATVTANGQPIERKVARQIAVAYAKENGTPSYSK
jgi:hypothetical protein